MEDGQTEVEPRCCHQKHLLAIFQDMNETFGFVPELMMFGSLNILTVLTLILYNEGRLSGPEEPMVLTQHEHCPDTIRSSFLLTQ